MAPEFAEADARGLTGHVDVPLRRLVSFHARYAPEIVALRRAIAGGDTSPAPYRAMVSARRLSAARSLPAAPGTIGGMFEIFPGMSGIDGGGLAPGAIPVVTAAEGYNGCSGWFEVPRPIDAPFVTVARSGAGGEVSIQMEPCAVGGDCLVLAPRPGAAWDMTDLALAAACIRSAPPRGACGGPPAASQLAAVPIESGGGIREWIDERLGDVEDAIDSILAPYCSGDERDAIIARRALAEIDRNPEASVRGKELEARLAELLA